MEKFKNAALESRVQEQRYITYKIIEIMFTTFAIAV